MKLLKLLTLGIVLFIAGSTQAQLSVHFNIGTPPAWGPAGNSDVRYYYLPDVEAYYDVQSSMFIYFEGNSWIRRSYLPSRYKNYDLYHGYKVQLNDYRGNTPYTHFSQQRISYPKGYHKESQKTIGERPGNHNDRDYRASNQANRGRYDSNIKNGNYDRKNDDNNYDKRGIEKNKKNDRGNKKNK